MSGLTGGGAGTTTPERATRRGPAWWGRPGWRLLRPVGGAAILAVLVWRLGGAPFRHGLAAVDPAAVAAVAGLTAASTVCAAWRWSLVARALGLAVPLRAAVPAYYRAQVLNATLPAGVLGDVHRAVRHGQAAGDLSRAARAVLWERTAGQVVQATLAVLVLLALPNPVRPAVGYLAGGLVLGSGAVLLARRGPGPAGRSTAATLAGTLRADLGTAVLARRVWPGVLLASVLVVAGHTATFLVAARAAGTTAAPARLLPLALLALVAAGVPVNLGGWGPREGVTAWAFGAAGLGGARGVSTAVLYGVLALLATLPGAVVLLADAVRRRHPGPVAGTALARRPGGGPPAWRHASAQPSDVDCPGHPGGLSGPPAGTDSSSCLTAPRNRMASRPLTSR